MTTKRSLETELDDVSDRVLADLPPDERVPMLLEAWADADRDRHERLVETTPVKSYRLTDPDVMDTIHSIQLLTLQARRELEVGIWQFVSLRLDARHNRDLYRQYGGEDGWEFLEEPIPENDFLDAPVKKRAARFYVDYLAWSQFAEEQLGVSLETFLAHAAPPGEGDSVFELIERTAKEVDGRLMRELDEDVADEYDPAAEYNPEDHAWIADVTLTDDGEECTPDEVATNKYENLAEAWVDTVPEAMT